MQTALDVLTCDSQNDVEFYSSPLFSRGKKKKKTLALVIILMYIKAIGRYMWCLLKKETFKECQETMIIKERFPKHIVFK